MTPCSRSGPDLGGWIPEVGDSLPWKLAKLHQNLSILKMLLNYWREKDADKHTSGETSP